jgi:alpha-ketoglutarate-dependent taurine dioxygenase
MTLTFKPLRPSIGAEVSGLDAADALDSNAAAAVREALDRYGVLVFPGLFPDDASQVAFSRALAPIVPAYRGDPANAPEFPEIFIVTLDSALNPAADYLRATVHWHIDGTTTDVPNMASVLSARELPAEGGAATEFCNTYAAWEALPEAEKREIDGLRIVHSLEASQRLMTADPSAEQIAVWRAMAPREHPLVWTHQSGRRSLVVGATASAVAGMGEPESRALLDRLLAWATRPEFVCRHEWSDGDLVIWDNRGTMHRAIPYAATARRIMHRTELAGHEAIA